MSTELDHLVVAADSLGQEFILLSDTLGLFMLTVAINQDKPSGCTEATVFGPFPFHVEGAPEVALGGDVAQGAKGTPCPVQGRMMNPEGAGVPGAVLDVWQSTKTACATCSTPVRPSLVCEWMLQGDGSHRLEFDFILNVSSTP